MGKEHNILLYPATATNMQRLQKKTEEGTPPHRGRTRRLEEDGRERRAHTSSTGACGGSRRRAYNNCTQHQQQRGTRVTTTAGPGSTQGHSHPTNKDNKPYQGLQVVQELGLGHLHTTHTQQGDTTVGKGCLQGG